MSDEFVRKDIYDIETRRIYGRIDDAVLRMEARNEATVARMEASLAEMKAQNAAFHEQVYKEISGMKHNINKMREDVDNLQYDLKYELQNYANIFKSEVAELKTHVTFIITIFGLVISAAVSIAIQIWK